VANTLGDQAINAALSVANGGTNNYSYTNLQLLRYNSSGTKIESAGVTASAIHDQNTDTGTTSTTFAIDSDASTPIKIKNAGSGLLEIRNDADDGYLDLKVGNLTVSGTTTTINTETLTIDDNIIVLNNNYTGGTPTESGGVEIERGTQTNASLIWNESSDVWQCGLSGGEATIRTGTVGVTVGGTGLTSATQGDIIYASGANTLSMLAKNTSATRYLSNTGSSNNPAWAQINLANGVTGTLGVTNGGTGLATVAAGSILAANSADTISAVTSSSGTKWLRNAAGTVSWQDAPTTSPAGSDTYIQFNNGGSAFGGSANLTWDDAKVYINAPTSETNEAIPALKLQATSTGTITTDFGPAIQFWTDGASSSATKCAEISGEIELEGQEDDGLLVFRLPLSGTDYETLELTTGNLTFNGTTASTTADYYGAHVYVTSTGTMASGFGARIGMGFGDTTHVAGDKVVMKALYDGAWNSAAYVLQVTETSMLYDAYRIDADRDHYVYLGDAAGARKWYVYDNSATPAAVASIDSDGLFTIDTVDIGTDLQLATSAPGSPVDGSIYWDSASDTLKVYDGAGWDSISPGGTPGGSDTYVQFNDSGSFGGSANLTWDDSQLSVTRPTTGTNAIEAVLRLELDTTNDMAQGFGPKIEFYVEDSGLSDQLAGWISIFRRDTDTTGGFQMNLNQAGTERQSLRISPVQAWLQGYSSATDSVFEVLNITANSTTTDAEGFGARVTLVPGSGSGETRLEAVRNADGDSNLNVYVDDGTALALGITPDRSHYVYLGDAAGARKWYVYDNSATPAAVASIDSDGEITAVDLTLETVSGVVLASTFNTHSDNVCQYYAGGGGTDEFEWYDGAQNGPAMKLSIATGVGHLDIHTVDIGTDLQLATTTPGTPVDGSIYWDSASDTLKVYDGASWDDINAAPAAPGGSNTYVQFNDSSSFGGDSGLTFTKGTDKLYVAGEVEIDGNLNHDGSNVGFYGATPAAQSTSWSVTNAGSQKSLDGTSCTPAQMASALCNVIQRLLDLGLISA